MSSLAFVIFTENVFFLYFRGANYDAEGKMRKWWKDESWNKFLEKGKCFVDFFNNQEIDGIKVIINKCFKIEDYAIDYKNRTVE